MQERVTDRISAISCSVFPAFRNCLMVALSSSVKRGDARLIATSLSNMGVAVILRHGLPIKFLLESGERGSKSMTIYDELTDDYEDPEDYYSCDNCGPWCEHWGGDNLCELEIDALAKEQEEFEAKYKSTRLCPICNQSLTCWQIPDVDELWHWSAKYHALIGLEIFSAYGVPKGVLHNKGNVYHIWVGEGEYREEKLIQPLGG